LVGGDLGPRSLDGIDLALSRESLAWSLARLRRDPKLLDYVSLAVPRGFHRPGAVPARARVTIQAGANELLAFEADARGGFEVPLTADHALSRAAESDGALWLVAR